MPFLFVLVVLSWAHLIASLRAAARAKMPLAGIHFLVLVPFLLAIADAFYLSPANTRGVPGNAQNWIPLLCLVFGVLSSTVFGFKLARMYRDETDHTSSGWRSGISFACVVAGIYLTGTAVNHWTFFSDSERSGIAAAQALGADDVKCDGMVLVRLDDDAADYRCPTSISFGTMTSHPFVPWPSYMPGRSARLKQRIEEVSRKGG